MNIREAMKQFIIEKVKESVSLDKPYFFLKWSGLTELCRQYNLDLLELVDELHAEKKIKKVLIKKRLALTLPELAISDKTKKLMQEFQEFTKKK